LVYAADEAVREEMSAPLGDSQLRPIDPQEGRSDHRQLQQPVVPAITH
jgi:hypothetical protein